MSAPIPTSEPKVIRSGDTTVWTRDLSADYSADDGWSLVYTLTLQSNAATRLAVTATADGVGFLVTITAAQTAALPAGIYNLFGHVTKDAERYQVFMSTVEIKVNLAAIATGDIRSTAKQALDAVEAVLLGRASLDQQSFEINGRRLDRLSIPDLRILLGICRTEYQREVDAELLAQGMGTRRRILTRIHQ